MTLRQLCKKDVVQLGSGTKLGRADDLELEVSSARVRGLVLRGRPRWFGLLGHEEDLMIAWQEIETIGEDVILVNCPLPEPVQKPAGEGIWAIFHKFVSS